MGQIGGQAGVRPFPEGHFRITLRVPAGERLVEQYRDKYQGKDRKESHQRPLAVFWQTPQEWYVVLTGLVINQQDKRQDDATQRQIGIDIPGIGRSQGADTQPA